jgi:hypothetical protein
MPEIKKIETKTDCEATKDSGRVRIGAGMIHFSDPTPPRDATKDVGRVRLGAGMIQF